MKTPICEMFDIEFPLIAFTHCRDVVVAVSKAGGMGVFGAVAHPPDRLEEELRWIDEHIEGKPYGIDLIVPNKMAEVSVGGLNRDKVEAAIPQEYFQFAAGILAQHDIPAEGLYSFRDETFRASQNMQGQRCGRNPGGGLFASDQARSQCAGCPAHHHAGHGQTARCAGCRPGWRQKTRYPPGASRG